MKCSKCKYFVKTKLHGTTCGCQGVKPCEVERKRKEHNKVRNKKKDRYVKQSAKP
jgi:hypothetical protein